MLLNVTGYIRPGENGESGVEDIRGERMNRGWYCRRKDEEFVHTMLCVLCQGELSKTWTKGRFMLSCKRIKHESIVVGVAVGRMKSSYILCCVYCVRVHSRKRERKGDESYKRVYTYN